MDHHVRSPPGTACQACRRMKMRCVREPDSPCARCRKIGRDCVTIETNRPATARHRRLNQASPAAGSRSVEGRLQQPLGRDATPLTAPILPSIYSTSAYANHLDKGLDGDAHDAHRRESFSNSSIQGSGVEGRISDYLSVEDTVQLIDMFREKLLMTIPILIPADYIDPQNLITNYPILVSCISYVTARYIPGYEGVRTGLTPVVSNLVQTALTKISRDVKEQMTIMQALLILYVFTRSSVLEKIPGQPSLSELNFWSVKATCEAFAMQINLHRAADGMRRQEKNRRSPMRADVLTRKYLYWILFYTMSHHTSIVTSTPPTMSVDASIRAAPILLKGLKSSNDVLRILEEVELCLLWDKLGKKDPSLKEWWCSTDLQDSWRSENSRLTFEDVDAALEEWKTQSQSDHLPSLESGFMNLSPDYHFHYTRFCLNTHFTQNIKSTNLQGDEIKAIERSVDSAVCILGLSRSLGPAKRDQLRYSPGFLFVTLSFCSSFILQAIQTFPTIFPNPRTELDLVRKTADFMIDLGVDKSHGAYAAGRLVRRQLDLTTDSISRGQSRVEEPTQGHAPTSKTGVGSVHGDEQVLRSQGLADAVLMEDINQPFSKSIFEFPGFFESRFLGMENLF